MLLKCRQKARNRPLFLSSFNGELKKRYVLVDRTGMVIAEFDAKALKHVGRDGPIYQYRIGGAQIHYDRVAVAEEG